MIKRTVYVLLFCTLCLVFIHSVDADEYQTITARELKERMDSGEDLFLINPLSEIEFNEGNIPGSVNIPYTTILETNKLPENKNTLIVTYCLGLK